MGFSSTGPVQWVLAVQDPVQWGLRLPGPLQWGLWLPGPLQWGITAVQWGVHGPGPIPRAPTRYRPTPVPIPPGTTTHYPPVCMSGSVSATLLIAAGVPARMSVFPELTPSGCLGKPLFVSSRASSNMPGLIVTIPLARVPLAWPTVW